MTAAKPSLSGFYHSPDTSIRNFLIVSLDKLRYRSLVWTGQFRQHRRLALLRGFFLIATPLTVASCGLFSRHNGTYVPPPQPVFIDQRAGTGFLPPLRPPPITRPVQTGPTVLSASFRAAHGQSFWAGLPQPVLPFPWPMLTLSPASAAVSLANPGPPPRVQRLPPRPGCGFVQVGAEQIPIDCATPGYTEILSAARSVLPDSIFRLTSAHAGAAELPAVVDHREDGTEGPVRHQGNVGACSAFSFAAAIDHALARRSANRWAVSVMHLWARYHNPSMSLPVDRNRNQPLTSEAYWPYTGTNQLFACTWVDKNQCKPYCGENCPCKMSSTYCGREVDAEQLAHADANPIARFTSATRIGHDKLTLMRALAQGQDIWMAMNFTYAAFDSQTLVPEHDGLRWVMGHFEPEDTSSTHAMVIAGYRVRSSGTYFLLHNSWGEAWGDRGYAWVHEKTLETNLRAAYLVDAELWNPSWSKVPTRQDNPSQCVNGLLPDSITGQCTPPCADGSARHNAACPDLTDCPAGYVNLYGECVVAAPNVRGSDPATGIHYACAAAGCGFVVPLGVYGCRSEWCSTSCPSPRFRLSYGVEGMRCTE